MRVYGDKYAFPHESEVGLTKRELFAAMAMQGLATNVNLYNSLGGLTKEAVHLADALIEALNEGKEQQ